MKQFFKKILRSRNKLLRSIVKLDKIFLADRLTFDKYYKLQKILGFPTIKLKFKIANNYYPDIETPKTFNEKITFLKLFSRNPIFPQVADKYAVRSYVKEKYSDELLIPLHQTVDNVDDLNFDKLPNQFILKTNFGSGQNILVRDKANLNVKQVKNELKNWMESSYRIQELIWFPQHIKRKIVVEELLTNAEGEIPTDYKFYVFDGKVKFVYLVTDRFGVDKRGFVTPEWERIEVKNNDYELIDETKKPKNLVKMIEISEKLAEEFDFMRVDLYTIGSKIYFGELTAYPMDGRKLFTPQSFDYDLGKLWEMDLTYLEK